MFNTMDMQHSKGIIMIKVYKFRICSSTKQKQILNQFIGILDFIYKPYLFAKE